MAAHSVKLSFTGDTVNAVSLVTLTRSDTGLPPTGLPTLPQAMSFDGTYWVYPFNDPAADPPLYLYTYDVTWGDGTTTAGLTGSFSPAEIAIAASGNYLATRLRSFQGLTTPQTWTITDASGNPVNLAGKTVRFNAYSDSGTPVGVFHYDNSTLGGVTLSGDRSNVVTLVPVEQDVATAQSLSYILWNVTDQYPLAVGFWDILRVSLTVP